jgi:hypothetical protein
MAVMHLCSEESGPAPSRLKWSDEVGEKLMSFIHPTPHRRKRERKSEWRLPLSAGYGRDSHRVAPVHIALAPCRAWHGTCPTCSSERDSRAKA